MKIYMSFWSQAYRNKEKTIDLIKTITNFNVKNINKIYDGVHFITDKRGAEIFKDIPWASVDESLEKVPIKYSQVWSLGKLYAYYKISKKREHFLHIDYDFLIFDRLPNFIENADIVFQSKEFTEILHYHTEIFHEKCIRKYLASEFNPERMAYNCGIIGGKDTLFFEGYSTSAIELVEDPINANLWLEDWKSQKLECFTKAVLAEQYYANLALQHYNLCPTLLWNVYGYNPADKKYFETTNCIHLYGNFKLAFLKDVFDIEIKS